jgi:predicted DNA-binding protein
MTSQLIVRLDSGLKEKVQRFAQAEGKTISQVIRELVETYVEDRDPEAFIGDLWDRIGRQMADRGLGAEDVDRAIQDVRAGSQ